MGRDCRFMRVLIVILIVLLEYLPSIYFAGEGNLWGFDETNEIPTWIFSFANNLSKALLMTWIASIEFPFPIKPGNAAIIAQKWALIALSCFLWVDVLQNIIGGSTSWNWYEEAGLFICLLAAVRFYIYFSKSWSKFKSRLKTWCSY